MEALLNSWRRSSDSPDVVVSVRNELEGDRRDLVEDSNVITLVEGIRFIAVNEEHLAGGILYAVMARLSIVHNAQRKPRASARRLDAVVGRPAKLALASSHSPHNLVGWRNTVSFSRR